VGKFGLTCIEIDQDAVHGMLMDSALFMGLLGGEEDMHLIVIDGRGGLGKGSGAGEGEKAYGESQHIIRNVSLSAGCRK
jgi:hypothetical protein